MAFIVSYSQTILNQEPIDSLQCYDFCCFCFVLGKKCRRYSAGLSFHSKGSSQRSTSATLKFLGYPPSRNFEISFCDKGWKLLIWSLVLLLAMRMLLKNGLSSYWSNFTRENFGRQFTGMFGQHAPFATSCTVCQEDKRANNRTMFPATKNNAAVSRLKGSSEKESFWEVQISWNFSISNHLLMTDNVFIFLLIQK